MNTKLFSKVSTILASVLVLAACGPTGQPSESESSAPTYATTQISAATAWDYDSQSPVLDGQLVRFEDAVITAQYGASNISVAQYNVISDSEVDIYAIEVLLAEELTGFDVKDIVTVCGTITSTDGRVQLSDATIEWGTDGQEACKGAGSLWYSGINDGSGRAWWDTVVRTDACQWFEFQAQFASVPTFTAGQATVFYIVFPGENAELDFETNWSLIDVHVPALTEEQATTLNTWAEQFEVGDYVKLFAQVWFKSYSCLMLPYTSFRFSGTNEPTEVKGLFPTWEAAAEELNTLYNVEFPTLTNPHIISWVVNLSAYVPQDTLLPWSIVTANATNGEEAFLAYFGEDTTYDFSEEGWVVSPIYQDPDTSTIFVDLMLNPVDEGGVTIYDFLIEVVLGATYLEMYFIPGWSGVINETTETSTTKAIVEAYAAALGGGTPYAVDKYFGADSWAISGYLAAASGDVQATTLNYVGALIGMFNDIVGTLEGVAAAQVYAQPTWDAENEMAYAVIAVQYEDGSLVAIQLQSYVDEGYFAIDVIAYHAG